MSEPKRTTVGSLWINFNDDGTIWGSGRAMGLKVQLRKNMKPKGDKSPHYFMVLSDDMDKETPVYREYAKIQAEYNLAKGANTYTNSGSEKSEIDDFFKGI